MVVPYENEIDVDASLRILESCNGTWVFDASEMRFRRVPAGSSLDMPPVESDWVPYFRLEVEPQTGAFAVALNGDDTRVLRSWLHRDPCQHCTGDSTGELSLESVRPASEADRQR